MRLIDADAYAAEMKKRQDACMKAMENASYEGEQFSPHEHWGGVLAAFAEAKLTLDDMPTASGWISVKDRLPEKEGRYLCWFGKNTVTKGAAIAEYLEMEKSFGSFVSLETYPNVTHWMPLPEPPEEVTGDG